MKRILLFSACKLVSVVEPLANLHYYGLTTRDLEKAWNIG